MRQLAAQATEWLVLGPAHYAGKLANSLALDAIKETGFTEAKAVVDGHVVTSMGPGTSLSAVRASWVSMMSTARDVKRCVEYVPRVSHACREQLAPHFGRSAACMSKPPQSPV